MDRRVKKIKVKDKKIMIIWESQSPVQKGEWDEYSLRCCDLARPELYELMTEVNTWVKIICELPDGYEKRIKTTGISFTHDFDEDGNWGVVLTAQMELYDTPAPLNINTPFKSTAVNEGMESCALDEDCSLLLLDIAKECFKYVDGDRAQGKLFDEKEKPENIEQPLFDDNEKIEEQSQI